MTTKVIVSSISKSVADNQLESMVLLDDIVRRELGDIYSPETWVEENFAKNLKGKWKYSRVALDYNNRLLGFWIASSVVPGNVHTHRVCVHPLYRQKGIAKKMFMSVASTIRKEQAIVSMTLSVHVRNQKAITFYEGLGFGMLSGKDLIAFLKTKHKEAEIHYNHIYVANYNYYILRRLFNEK